MLLHSSTHWIFVTKGKNIQKKIFNARNCMKMLYKYLINKSGPLGITVNLTIYWYSRNFKNTTFQKLNLFPSSV
jgi:hypothetical protein